MSKKRYEIKQNYDGKHCLFDNERNGYLMISENNKNLLDICNILNKQSTIIELQEMIIDLKDDDNQLFSKLRQVVCDMLNNQETTIDHLAQERDYWKNKTMDLLYRFGELKSPRERLMNYHYEMGD